MRKNSMMLVVMSIVLATVCGCNSKLKSTSGETKEVSTVKTNMGMPFTKLDNYFLKNTVNLQNDVNLIVPKDSSAFDNFFGMARTMANEIINPDFNQNSIAAIACKASNVATTIAVNQVVKQENGISVYVTIQKGETQSYTSTPVVIFSFEKQPDGTPIHVIENNNILATESL